MIRVRITCRYKYRSSRRRGKKREIEYMEFENEDEYRKYMRKKILRGAYKYCRVSFLKG